MLHRWQMQQHYEEPGLPMPTAELVGRAPPPHLVSSAGSNKCLGSKNLSWPHLDAPPAKDQARGVGDIKLESPRSAKLTVALTFVKKGWEYVIPSLPCTSSPGHSGAWPGSEIASTVTAFLALLWVCPFCCAGFSMSRWSASTGEEALSDFSLFLWEGRCWKAGRSGGRKQVTVSWGV